MTVQSDLKKALTAAEIAKGSYENFAAATEDQMAKSMFQQMSQDMNSHIQLFGAGFP